MMQEYKYLYGSKLLKLNNPHDEDWLIFIDLPASKIRVAQRNGKIKTKNVHSLPLIKTLMQHFLKKDHVKVDPYKALYLYQLSGGFFTEDPEYIFKDFNVLDYKEVWSLWLKTYVNSEDTETLACHTSNLPKHFYQLLYQYYMIKENTHWISEEAKAEVQKIHDLEKPSSYFYELRDLINSL